MKHTRSSVKSKESYIGIIGGSGLYSMSEFVLKKKVTLSTPFGKPSDSFFIGTLSGKNVIFLPRHGIGHRLNPSEINYKANIWGMKKLGAEAVFSVSAVGSLKEEINPGHIVIIDQFIDRTRRPITFFEKGIVAHVSFAHPICEHLRNTVIPASQKAGAFVHKTGTYVCMEGPQFSTKAESLLYRKMNADVIGMTNLTEAKLAREAEICYVTIALSTDYDCWHESKEPVTTDQILAVLHKNIILAQQILKESVQLYKSDPNCSCKSALKHAIMTDPKKITKSAKTRLNIIAGKYI